MTDDGFLFELPPVDLKIADQKFRERNPIWTGCKAKLIERYLFYFVQITYHGTYIDCFAGPQEMAKLDMWSAKLVIESRPRWLNNFVLFELDEQKISMLQQMCDGQPPRDKKKGERQRNIRIVPGDFNANVLQVLVESPIKPQEATFCLLDQRTFECDWASVQQIAGHKTAGHKIELFYFFPEGWINRSIAALKIGKEERLQRWWGDQTWQRLLQLNGALRAQFVSDRMKAELQYRHVYPFPIYEKEGGAGRVMYYMIHASDHDDAPKLMSRAYGKALDIKESDEQLEFMAEELGTRKSPSGEFSQ